jgi:hypothetical protein
MKSSASTMKTSGWRTRRRRTLRATRVSSTVDQERFKAIRIRSGAMRTIWTVVCVAMVLAAGGPARAAVSFDTLLPEGTVLYVSVRDLPELLEKLRETEGYKAFRELRIFERVVGPDEFKKMQDLYGRFIEPLGEIFSGEVAFAITSTEEINEAPRILLLADVSEGEAALKKYLEGTIYPLLKEQGAEPEELTRGGVTYTKLLPDPEDPDEPLIFTVRDGVLMAAVNPEVLEGVIKPGPKTLRASESYADVRRALRGADVQIYFDAGVFIRKALGGEGDEMAAAWMEVFGLDRLRAVGVGLGVGPTGGTTTLRLTTEGRPAGFLGAFVRGGGPIKSIKYVPEDAGLYYVLNFESLLGVYREFADGLEAVSDEFDLMAYEDFADGIENIEALLAMNLEEDVLAGFGGEIALSAKIPDALGIPPAALLIEVEDKVAVEKFVARILELLEAFAGELETTTAKHKGVEITTVLASPQITPGVAVLDEFLVVGTHPNAVRAIIDTAAEGTNIGTSKDYRAAMAGLPTEGAAMMYLDVQGLFEFLFPIVAARAPSEGRGGELIKELGSLGEHLSGFGMVLTGDDSGLTYRMHSPKALLQPALVFGAGMMLPALQRAREAARSAVSMSNVRQLSIGIMMYAHDHDDRVPEKLSDLVAPEQYHDSPGVFVHPKNKAKAKLIDFDKPETIDEHSDYELVLKGSLGDVKEPSKTVMIREKEQFSKKGRVIGYADGHVGLRSEDEVSEAEVAEPDVSEPDVSEPDAEDEAGDEDAGGDEEK